MLTEKEAKFLTEFLDKRNGFSSPRAYEAAFGPHTSAKPMGHQLLKKEPVQAAIRDVLDTDANQRHIKRSFDYHLKNVRSKHHRGFVEMYLKVVGGFAPEKVISGVINVNPEEILQEREEIMSILKGKRPVLQASEAKENIDGNIEVLVETKEEE